MIQHNKRTSCVCVCLCYLVRVPSRSLAQWYLLKNNSSISHPIPSHHSHLVSFHPFSSLRNRVIHLQATAACIQPVRYFSLFPRYHSHHNCVMFPSRVLPNACPICLPALGGGFLQKKRKRSVPKKWMQANVDGDVSQFGFVCFLCLSLC